MKNLRWGAFLLMLLVLLLLPVQVFAEEEQHRDLDEIVSEIKTDQQVDRISAIDPSSVNPDVLEELGDAVMAEIIGSPAMHERMDDRFGGEGSEVLASFHKELGYRYLSGMPLRRSSLMALMMNSRIYNQERGSGRMMGYDWMGIGWLGALLIGLAVLAGFVILVILVVHLSRSNAKTNLPPADTGKTYLENAYAILADRFARGEINDEQYAKMKAELKK